MSNAHKSDKKIVIISGKWHAPIVESAEKSCVAELTARGYNPDNITIIKAPGALEIPLIGQVHLQGDYDLAIGISFIVNGMIYHNKFVAQSVVDGIVNVSLKTAKPFLSVCLAPHGYSEVSPENEAFFVNHFVKKGEEAADAADDMLALLG